MQRRQELLQELDNIMNQGSTSDPKHNEVKRLQVVTAKILIEVVETLERIDVSNKETVKTLARINETNKKIGRISENLGKTSNTMQKWMLGLTVLIVVATLVTLYVATKAKPTVNNYNQYVYEYRRASSGKK